MSASGKPVALGLGLLGLWVFLALALPLTYYFGGSVFPKYQCDHDCTVNDSAGLLTSLVFLVSVLSLVFGGPQLVRRKLRDRSAARAPQHRPVVLRRMPDPAPPPRGAPGFLLRVALYLVLALMGGFVLFWVGGAHFEAAFCSAPDFDGECDVAIGEGFVWTGTWVALVVVAGFCVELQLVVNWYLRRRGRLST